jgi:hypothetical protein
MKASQMQKSEGGGDDGFVRRCPWPLWVLVHELSLLSINVSGVQVGGAFVDDPLADMRIVAMVQGRRQQNLKATTLRSYAEAIGKESGQAEPEPARLIMPMIQRFMATDRAFGKVRKGASRQISAASDGAVRSG